MNTVVYTAVVEFIITNIEFTADSEKTLNRIADILDLKRANHPNILSIRIADDLYESDETDEHMVITAIVNIESTPVKDLQEFVYTTVHSVFTQDEHINQTTIISY